MGSDYGHGCATGNKVCCCSSKASASIQEKVVAISEEESPPQHLDSTGFTCSQWCSDGGHGDYGQIIGTAPFCGASCNSDCPNGACELATSEMSDYGHGCATGNKVCCCSGKATELATVV